MGHKRLRYLVPAMVVLGLGAASLALAASQGPANHGFGKTGATQFRAILTGHQETPANHTKALGRLTLTLNTTTNTLSYELTYSGLTTPASAAHVHFGQPNVPGGVSFFLCGGGTKQPCPPGTTTAATVTGTVAASDVLGPTTQGIAAGDLPGILQEMRAGFTYANIHNATYPNGEIRGQIFGGRSHERGHDSNRDDDDDND